MQAIPQVIKDSFICCKVAIIQWVFWNAFSEFESALTTMSFSILVLPNNSLHGGAGMVQW